MYPPAQQPIPDLLIDGYIANMVGPQAAGAYHSTLLRRGAGPLRAYNDPRYPRTFLAVPSPVPGLGPPTPWVVDTAVEDMGTVIPQTLWAPRLQRELLRPPIFFFGTGGLGLPLNQAAEGDCMSLRGASRPAPFDATCSTHAQIRIYWRGYSGWDEQILIRAQDAGQTIVRLEKFVTHVARKVQKFMTRIAANQPYNDNDGRWVVGARGITPDHVVLIGVVQVSQGSWMPILQLNRFAVW